MHKTKKNYSVLSILIVAFLVRGICALIFPTEAGDSPIYTLLAENIFRGCGLSYSDPNSAECILTSGGYFPGYPAFIASIWYLFAKKTFLILMFQIACYIFALYWLLRSVDLLTKNSRVVLAVGLFMALSPLQLGWFRFVLTEPLAISISIWFLAELFLSIAQKRLRILPLSIALAFSIYIRPDTAFMILGLVPTTLYIYDTKKAFIKILTVLILTSLPVSAWMVRNSFIGHDLLTKQVDYYPASPGYINWWKTWVVNEYERADIFFPIWVNNNYNYSKIKIHNSKYINDIEMIQAQNLVDQLKKYEGRTFPKNLDSQFQKLYKEKIRDRSFFVNMAINGERALYLVFNPFSSWGMPFELKDINKKKAYDALKAKDFSYLSKLAKENYVAIIGKTTIFIYRLLLFFLLCLAILNLNYFKKPKTSVSELNIVILSVSLYFVARLAFFVSLVNLESRYLIEAVVWIEIGVIIWTFEKYPNLLAHKK